jgi:hypothetical protein
MDLQTLRIENRDLLQDNAKLRQDNEKLLKDNKKDDFSDYFQGSLNRNMDTIFRTKMSNLPLKSVKKSQA